MRLATALAAAGLALASPAIAAIDANEALGRSHAAIGSEPRAFAFTDTAGQRVTLADYRGKPLVVSLVYTGCSQVCPLTTRNLAKAVAAARKVVGEDAFRIVSIGFNIPYDNPVSMRVFARQNAIDDPRWSFLTPDAGVPEALARDLGFTFAPQAGGFDHLAQVTILDGAGRIRAQLYGEAFELPMLVAPLRELALGATPAVPTLAGWIERVRLICTVYDPATGAYRLDFRLFIEIAVGLACLGLTAAFLAWEFRRARKPPC